MQIAYINKGKIKAKSTTDQMLERAYSRDIRLTWNKRKEELIALGFTERAFVAELKLRFNAKYGLYSS